MQISIIQAILIGTLYYLTNNGVPWLTGLGSVSIRQPICAGTIVGLILESRWKAVSWGLRSIPCIWAL